MTSTDIHPSVRLLPSVGALASIAALAADEPWMEDALCAETDQEAFFPDKGGSTRSAKSICQRCGVRAECLEYALAHDERFGIWGGMSERERRPLLVERRKARLAAQQAQANNQDGGK